MAGDWCTRDSLGPCICSASSPLLRHCRDCGQSRWLPACSDIHLGSRGTTCGPCLNRPLLGNPKPKNTVKSMLQGTNIPHLGKRKIMENHFQQYLGRGYLGSQEHITFRNLQGIKSYQIWVTNGHGTRKRHCQAFCHSGVVHRTCPQNATPVNLGTAHSWNSTTNMYGKE